jgi:class 3 adenylate cyclase
MEKWKAKNPSHFPTPPTTATEDIYHTLRYTTISLVQKIGQARFNFNQTVGIDGSSIRVARSGLRDNNDLIWVGRAPNIAAKLSSVRVDRFKTLITSNVYNALDRLSRFQGSPERDLWTFLNWAAGNAYGIPRIYGSRWIWTPQ